MKNQTELLAPAGDIRSFYAACNAGADAVYMGLDRFNARAMAENFSLQEYIECIRYAHRLGMKVYLTINTIMTTEEVIESLNLIYDLYINGLDAVIVQDMGLASKIHEVYPDLALHASTQMSVYSLRQVKILEKLGFSRVVLARELSVDEIEYICKNTNVEIEVFVHGALCVSVSGQCLFSYMIGRRSANRGQCAQPCRMRYTLINDSKNKVVAENRYLLSKKDIFGIDEITRLKEAGVCSFKIEGRNRSYQYVGLVVSKYRKALDDKKVSREDKTELEQIFIRSSKSSGYLKKVEYKNSITEVSPKNTGIYLGEVLDQKGKFVKIRTNIDVSLHDGFEIYNASTLNLEYSSIITCIKSEKCNLLNDEIVPKGTIVFIGDVNKKVTFGSKIYKTSSYNLNLKYSKMPVRKPNMDVTVTIEKGKEATAISYVGGKTIITSGAVPDEAKKVALDEKKVSEAFSKTGQSDIEFGCIKVNLDKNLFLPVSALNDLRRMHSERLCENFDKSFLRAANKEMQIKISKISNGMQELDSMKENITRQGSLFIYNFNKRKTYDITNMDNLYIFAKDFIVYEEEIFALAEKFKLALYVNIPNFVGKNQEKYIISNLERLVKRGVKGILLGSFDYYDLALFLKEKYGIKLVADYSFNISNIYSAYVFKNLKFDTITPSIEIEEEERRFIAKISNIENVQNYITVMTSRYCVIGAFQENRLTVDDKCKKPCLRDSYIIKDEKGYVSHIICDPFDCIMRIVKPIKSEALNDSFSTRKCIL